MQKQNIFLYYYILHVLDEYIFGTKKRAQETQILHLCDHPASLLNSLI